MKKSLIIVFCIMFMTLTFYAVSVAGKPKTEYLRIHIRADSNDFNAQEVKYKVKDKIVDFLTPLICECESTLDAKKVINLNLKNIENIADGVLKSNGFSYFSRARLNNEKFPTRVYNDLTLEEGYYDALIIELGSGKGDNWWCVVYPPLCFVGNGTNYIYKSKIMEIIEKFKK